MARGGYRANAGRPRGAKNASTIEREMTLEAERLRERGTKTDLAAMLEIRDYWMAIAGREQKRFQDEMSAYEAQRVAGNTPKEKPVLDLELMSKALSLAGDMASKRAPFLHARLQSVAVTQQPWDLTKLSDEELDALERLQRKAAAGSNAGRESSTQH